MEKEAERPRTNSKKRRRAEHVSVQGLGVVPGHEEEAEGPRTAVKEGCRLGLERFRSRTWGVAGHEPQKKKGEAMRPRTENAAPRVFPRGDFLWSLAMKVRPGDRARMSSRAPRVFPRRD